MNGWPTLNPDALYGLAGDVVSTILPHTEADPAALLGTFLTCAGASIGPGPHAMADGARHPGRLFLGVVGRTSDGRKGSSWAQIRRVMEVADPDFTSTRVLGGFGSGEVLVDEVRDPSADDPGANDKRLLVHEPELARIFKVANREGSTLSTTVRDAYDGGRLQARSRTRTSVASNASVAVVGHITPDELHRHLTATEIAAGLGNRFLIVLSRRSKRLPEGGNLDDSTIHDLGTKVRRALEEARRVSRLVRTDPAKKQWAILYDEIAENASDGLVGALTARAEAQLLRLSVLYALLDGARQIDVQHLSAASAYWTYCRDSVDYLYSDSTGDEIADRLLTALRAALPAGLDGTQVRDLFSRHMEGKRLDAARDLLVECGLAEVVKTKTEGRPKVVTFALAIEETEATKPDWLGEDANLSSQHATEGRPRDPGDWLLSPTSLRSHGEATT